MNFLKYVLVTVIVFCFFVTNAQEIKWNEVESGVWKTTIGKEGNKGIIKELGIDPQSEALNNLSKQDFPLSKKLIHAEVVDGKTYLRFPLKREEQLYGLGLNFKTHNQRGRILNLHVDHYAGEDNGRTHAPVPFYVSSEGYGVLIDAAKYITVYAGTGIRVDADDAPELIDRNTDDRWEAQPYSDAVEILIPADGTDVYIFAGNSPMETVQRYNLFNGGGYLPPKWGLGFTQRVPTLYSASDILNEVEDFEKHDFPLDFIGVEPGWQSMAYPCTFEWDNTRFPEPDKFLNTLKNKGVKANLWINPYVSPKSTIYSKLKNLSGTHTVWNGLVPDLTLDETKIILKEHFTKNHLDYGVSGYKVDEVDGFDFWVWPDVAKFPSGTTGEEMRQLYGVLIQQITGDWFKERNQRTYGLVRASNAGASSFPYVIYDDYYSHKDFISALINSSFIGVLWTPEVRGSKTAEEWLRRMQSVCFSPMAMLNAWADGTKPWSFPEVEKEVRDVARLRMQLLPYIYSTFAQYKFEGKPPFRAMQLVDGFSIKVEKEKGNLHGTDNPYAAYKSIEVQHQYMMGDYLLVAPMFAGEKNRQVVLPKGKWYNFYTGDLVGGNEVISISPGLDEIPVFVKNGGIIPMIESQNQMPKPNEEKKLIIRHYGTIASETVLYDDDGVSFDFEKGECSFTLLRVNRNGEKFSGEMQIGNKDFFSYMDEAEWVFMTTPLK